MPFRLLTIEELGDLPLIERAQYAETLKREAARITYAISHPESKLAYRIRGKEKPSKRAPPKPRTKPKPKPEKPAPRPKPKMNLSLVGKARTVTSTKPPPRDEPRDMEVDQTDSSWESDLD